MRSSSSTPVAPLRLARTRQSCRPWLTSAQRALFTTYAVPAQSLHSGGGQRTERLDSCELPAGRSARGRAARAGRPAARDAPAGASAPNHPCSQPGGALHSIGAELEKLRIVGALMTSAPSAMPSLSGYIVQAVPNLRAGGDVVQGRLMLVQSCAGRVSQDLTCFANTSGVPSSAALLASGGLATSSSDTAAAGASSDASIVQSESVRVVAT